MDQALTYQQRVEARARERTRAEDISDWPFKIPRETMDRILADPVLGVREHLALAATCLAFRRIYHNNDVFRIVVKRRSLPVRGRQQYPRWEPYGREDAILDHLATRPQKRKANGPFMKAIADKYMVHEEAVVKARKFRITAVKVKEYYPNLTDEHLSLLRYYEQDHRGYPNQWTDEGYMETAVEWLSIRVRNGWNLPRHIKHEDSENVTTLPMSPPMRTEGIEAGAKRKSEEEEERVIKKARRF